MNKKFIQVSLLILTSLVLLSPFMVFKDLLFPYITSKAFYLRIVVELTLPFYFYLLLSNPKLRPSLKNPLTLSVLCFFIFNLISAFLGVNVLKSIWGNFERMGGVFYLAHLTLLYFYVLLLGQLNTKYLRIFLQIVFWSATIVSLDAVMVWLTKNHFLLNDPSYPRVSGTFGNPIFIASFLILPMVIGLFLALGEETKVKKNFYFFGTFLQALVIFLSGTRGALVGLILGLFVSFVCYIILTPKKKFKLWGGTTLIVFVLAATTLFTFHSKLPAGSMLHRLFNLRDSNTEARLIQWKSALKGFIHYPVFGVGSENYYVISNKYYDPKIYNYDPSWFDKPHNYLIEVLVTNGIVGFLSYLAILVFGIWAMWMAFRGGIIILEEFCILLLGFLAYQIQNLFVFDTVAASIMFFAFAGLLGFLWHEHVKTPEQQNKKKTKEINSVLLSSSFAAVFIFLLYVLYSGNIAPMIVSKAINYGYGYGSVDPQIAEGYFERLQTLYFNFDPIQSSNKYTDFATNLILNPGKQSPEFVNNVVAQAIEYQKKAIVQVPNDPTAYQELVTLYLADAATHQKSLDPEAVIDINKALSLAPLRPELQLVHARLQIYEKNIPEAITTLQKLLQEIPDYKDAQLQLALVYWYNNRGEDAVPIAQKLLDEGFIPAQASQIYWLGSAYESRNETEKAINVYQFIILKIAPNDINSYVRLAQLYANLGRRPEAIAAAEKLLELSPSDAKSIQNFINSLK